MNFMTTQNASRSLMLAGYIAAVPGCIFDTIHGSGRPTEQSRNVPAFTGVEVSAGLHADVATGPLEVLLSGDDNIVPNVATSVRGGVLYIEPMHDLDPVVPLSIVVRSPGLGAAKLRAGGGLSVHDVTAPVLHLEVEAGGTLVARGNVDRLSAALSAGGTLDAIDMPARSIVLHGRAGGLLVVNASEEVSGSVESGADALVFGRPARRSVGTASGGSVSYIE